MSKKYLSAPQVAEILAVSKMTAIRRMKSLAIDGANVINVGTEKKQMLRIAAADLDKYCQSQRIFDPQVLKGVLNAG